MTELYISNTVVFREATASDAETIFHLIRQLAQYQGELDSVKNSTEALRLDMQNRKVRCLLAEKEKQAVGYALFFETYSPWVRIGLWLEDLFVVEKYRGRGVGTKLFRSVADIVVQEGYARLEWAVRDIDTEAQEFYKKMGAKANTGWTMWEAR